MWRFDWLDTAEHDMRFSTVKPQVLYDPPSLSQLVMYIFRQNHDRKFFFNFSFSKLITAKQVVLFSSTPASPAG